MKKRLSIVIPRYRESEREVFPLLASIADQVGVGQREIEVIIANDGGGAGALNGDFLALFGLDIRQIQLERNGGCGVARQAAIDTAGGDYILCCDADDVLHNVGVLGAALEEAEKTAADILTTNFLEELLMPDGSYQYITHDGPVGCWMHGKFLRRQFLVQNNIRFHDDLKEHEDSYYLCIAMALSEQTRHMPIVSYVWKYNPNSITRHDGGIYTYECAPTYAKAMTMALETVERCRPEQMQQRVLQLMMYHYFTLHRADWLQPERAEYLSRTEDTLAKCLTQFLHYYKDADPAAIAQTYNFERNRNFAGGVETETFADWVGRVFGK